MVNDKHYFYEKMSLYGFIITIDSNGQEIKGEAFAKGTQGSKNWSIGKPHEFELKESGYAIGGYQIKGLKCLETTHEKSAQVSTASHDIVKESYVISRFAHQIAIDYLNSLEEKDRNEIIKTIAEKDLKELDKNQIDEIIVNAGRKYISKVAKSMAESVEDIAILVQKVHEKPEAS